MPDKKVKLFFGKGGDSANALKGVDDAVRYQPHLIVVQLGEHAKPVGGSHENTRTDVENIQKEICKSKNIPFASVEKYAIDPSCSGTGESGGVRWHPNDAGQAGYAKELFSLFKEYYRQ
jgi:hypothetical protein